jgi:hypothetical protein
MNIARLILAASAAWLAVPATAAERDQLNQRQAVTLDPARSYILYRTPVRAPVQFVREATAEERSAYQTARETAYQRARTRYERAFARWEREEAACGNSQASHCRYRPERPATVTPETFSYPPLELTNLVTVERSPLFERSEAENVYLLAVTPGTYSLYGQITLGENGPIGVCLCMGSVRFEAPAGRIVDLGTISYPGEARQPAVRRMASQLVTAPAAGALLPPRLAGLPVVQAELRAAGKLPNFFAVEIDRHPPIDGVLAYDRDRVIDLRAGSASASRPD